MSALPGDPAAAYSGTVRGSSLSDFIGRLRADRSLLRRVLMLGGIAVVALGALVLWLMGDRYVSTDDAYVQAPKLMVSTDVSGLVATVNVKEGDVVKKGQVLFTLDQEPFRIALDTAKAQLAQTRLNVDAMKEDYRRMLSNVAAQQSAVVLAGQNLARYTSLAKANAISPATLDQSRQAASSARDQLAALQQTAQTQLAKLNGDPNLPAAQAPEYQQALTRVTEAQRQLDHTVVRAPFAGIVAEVDSLQPGTLVISAMSAFTTTSAVGLVGTGETWIEAHMKETDLTRVHDNDPVEVTVDTYPGCTWQGHVGTVSPVTGSAFSVLPAENASGNWVKVVQRIPVRISIDKGNCDRQLRPGMSTFVSIDTGQRRWHRFLFGGS